MIKVPNTVPQFESKLYTTITYCFVDPVSPFIWEVWVDGCKNSFLRTVLLNQNIFLSKSQLLKLLTFDT